MAFQTPILLIAFNRPDHTAKVLASIKKQQPKCMFVFRDGPRQNVLEDIQKCQRVEDMIRKEINWDCELKTWIETKNLGCGYGPAKAISWFFEHVGQGIILEDDVVPSPSFFPFMEQLLNRYKEDNRIAMITGFNNMGKWRNTKYSYFFSYLGGTIAGWATWRRSWKYFDFNMVNWKDKKSNDLFRKNIKSKTIINYYNNLFEKLFNEKEKDYWDYQWFYARSLIGCTIIPAANLAKNIGFDEYATHTLGDIPKNLEALKQNYSLDFPLKHRAYKVDRLFEKISFELHVNPQKRTIIKRIILKILKTIIYKKYY